MLGDEDTQHLLSGPPCHAELQHVCTGAPKPETTGESPWGQHALQPWAPVHGSLGSDFTQKRPIFSLVFCSLVSFISSGGGWSSPCCRHSSVGWMLSALRGTGPVCTQQDRGQTSLSSSHLGVPNPTSPYVWVMALGGAASPLHGVSMLGVSPGWCGRLWDDRDTASTQILQLSPRGLL